MTVKEYKEYKGLQKESLRNNMSRMEELLTDLGEETTKELAKEYKPLGLSANKKIARIGGNARDDIEKRLNRSIITSDNNLNYKYLSEKEKIENK